MEKKQTQIEKQLCQNAMKKTNCGPNPIQWDLSLTIFSLPFLDNRHCNQYSCNWVNRNFCLWFIFRTGFQTVKDYIQLSRAGKRFDLFQWFVSNIATEKLTDVLMHSLVAIRESLLPQDFVCFSGTSSGGFSVAQIRLRWNFVQSQT